METIELLPTTSASLESKFVETLDKLFPEQQREESKLKKSKEILGNITNEINSEQLLDANTEIQFLINTWLDGFERNIFGGLTLNELLHEKGAA